MEELILKHAKVIFSELTDKGFGRSITIDVTDPEVQKAINDWAEKNGITPKFKDYTNKDGETTKQYLVKFSDYTQIAGKDGLGESNLGYGSIVNINIRAFEYNNKFGKGVSSAASAVFVVEGKVNSTMDKLAE